MMLQEKSCAAIDVQRSQMLGVEMAKHQVCRLFVSRELGDIDEWATR